MGCGFLRGLSEVSFAPDIITKRLFFLLLIWSFVCFHRNFTFPQISQKQRTGRKRMQSAGNLVLSRASPRSQTVAWTSDSSPCALYVVKSIIHGKHLLASLVGFSVINWVLHNCFSMVEVFLTHEVTQNSFTRLDLNFCGFMASKMVVFTN